MYILKALNTTLKREEIFYCSNNISSTDFKDCLKYIKHGYPRNWIRPNRKIISEHENQTLTFRQEMKYIVMSNNGVKSIFIFDKEINHDYFYQAIKFLDEEFHTLESAGFTNGISCYGTSETLNKDSNPEDIKLIM